MKVNPLEVEAILQQHPGVAACAVIGVKQSATVNRLKAIVVPRDPNAPPSVEELRQLARAHLSNYKIPRAFEIRPALPRSDSGKILRHLLETM
jgi:acyl-coenzyme A synthetase/AMP-(fatty) acid ligase